MPQSRIIVAVAMLCVLSSAVVAVHDTDDAVAIPHIAQSMLTTLLDPARPPTSITSYPATWIGAQAALAWHELNDIAVCRNRLYVGGRMPGRCPPPPGIRSLPDVPRPASFHDARDRSAGAVKARTTGMATSAAQRWRLLA